MPPFSEFAKFFRWESATIWYVVVEQMEMKLCHGSCATQSEIC